MVFITLLNHYFHAMKKIFLLLLVCTFGIVYNCNAASIYQVDDSAIESAFNVATPIVAQLADVTAMVNPFAAAPSGDKNAWVAVILDLLIGGLAIHRVYLGAKPMMIVYYLITCGGIFGIVPLVDLVVLIINNADIDKYVGSNKFFMWG